MFQGAKRCPNDLEIYEHQFYEGISLGSEGSKRAEAWGPKGGGPRGQIPWPRGGPPSGAAWLRCRRSFRPRIRLDLKPTIKIAPRCRSQRDSRKQRNTKTETWTCWSEGENSGGALLAWSPSPPTTSPWWRGSSPPLDYWFVELTYVSLLSPELH